MNNNLLLAPLFASVLSLTACASFTAANKDTRAWGEPADTSAATQTVVIQPNTAYVNLAPGETVKFVAGGKAFAWSFAPQGGFYFDLRRIAPPGAVDHRVMVAVAPNEHFYPSAT